VATPTAPRTARTICGGEGDRDQVEYLPGVDAVAVAEDGA
jgi:hypothetical protein